MARGRYKYVCEECNEETWLGYRERNSRFKPRCSSCGSLWLIPSKASVASDRIAEAKDAKKESMGILEKKMNIKRHDE